MSETKFSPQLSEPGNVPAFRGGNEAGQFLERAGAQAGGLFGTIIKGIDDKKQDTIRQEADVVANFLEGQASGNFDIDKKEKKTLDRLGIAANFGTITPAQVAIAANSAAKNLKGKYPGFEDIIDAEIDARVYGGLRGRVLQESFAQLSEKQKADAKKAQDDAQFYEDASKAGALVDAREDTITALEVNGHVIDTERTRLKLNGRRLQEADIAFAQSQLTFNRGRFGFNVERRDDARNERVKELGALTSNKILNEVLNPIIPQLKKIFDDGKISPLESNQIIGFRQQIDDTVRAQAELLVNSAGISLAEAYSALEPLQKGLERTLNIYSSGDTNAMNILSAANQGTVENAVGILLNTEPNSVAFAALSQILGDNVTPEVFDRVYQDMNRGDPQKWINVLNGANPGEELNRNFPPGNPSRATVLKESWKGVNGYFRNPSPETEEPTIVNLNILSSNPSVLNNPFVAKDFMNKVVGGGRAEDVIKLLDKWQGDNRADQTKQIIVESSKGLLDQGVRELGRELVNDASLKNKELKDAFVYNPATGKIDLKAQRTKTFFIRGRGETTVKTSTSALNEIHTSLQTSIDVLRASGEDEYVTNLAEAYGWIKEPSAKTE